MERHPSHYLAQYLKLDLQIGRPTVHPVAAAMDAAMDRHASEFLESVSRGECLEFSIDRERQHLSSLGFPCGCLLPEEVERLFAKRDAILAGFTGLSTIRLLSQIYLGQGEVRRGRPLGGGRLGRSARTVLTDVRSGDRVVFVRLVQAVEESRVEAFQEVVSGLLPAGFELVLSGPLGKKRSDRAGFRLQRENLTERRV